MTSLKPPSNNLQPTSNNQVQVDKFTFSLKGCERDEKTVKCIFEIINRGKEEAQVASNTAQSYIIDVSGKSYQADSLDMGGRIVDWSGSREATVVPGIESFVSIKIINVPSEVTYAKVLEFNTTLGKKVQFRNVPILK